MARGKARSVIAGPGIHARLRSVSQAVLGQFQNAFRALKAIHLGSLRSQAEPHVDRNLAVLEQRAVHVRHVPAVFPAQDASHRHRLPGRLVDAQHVLHSAHQVDQQIARHAGAVFLPATPARKDQGIEVPLGHGSLPGVPIERLRGKIGAAADTPRLRWDRCVPANPPPASGRRARPAPPVPSPWRRSPN